MIRWTLVEWYRREVSEIRSGASASIRGTSGSKEPEPIGSRAPEARGQVATTAPEGRDGSHVVLLVEFFIERVASATRSQ